MDALRDSLASAMDWVEGSGIRVALIILGGTAIGYVVARLIRLVVGRAFRSGISSIEYSEWSEARRLLPRLRTLEAVINRTITSVVMVVVFFVVASDAGLRIEPFVASAGLVGIAFAFGAQTLIRDALSGVFLLVDGTYNVGDYVRINAVEGIVSDISLRRTLLRSDDGTIHTIPNGAVTVISNFTREVAQHTFTLRLHADTTLEDLARVLEDVTSELSTAPEVGDEMVGGPTIAGIVAFRGSTYDVEIRSSVRPSLRSRWPQLLNARLVRAFERHGVSLPD